MHVSKLSVRRVTNQIEYADSESLLESLNGIRAAWGIPILRYFQDLLDGKVDSVAFTKDKPYYYFFGRRFEKSISVTVKEAEKIIEFSMPLSEAEKLLTA